MSVTSFSSGNVSLRPVGDGLVGGASYTNNSTNSLKKSHLLTTTSGGLSSSVMTSNDSLRKSGSSVDIRKNNTSNSTTTSPTRGVSVNLVDSTSSRSSTTAVAVPTIKVTPAPPSSGNGSTATPSETPAATTLPKAYGKIVLTLENVLLPNEKLSPTPSSLDGLDEDNEMDLRIMGCELITTAGILLKLPQTAMATGQVLFQRFYYSKSFIRQPMEPTAMACIYLASKIEEAPRRIRDVVNVFHHIKLVRAGKPIQPMILDAAYIRTKNDVTLAERRVLKELGFCVHVKHPHKLIVIYLQQLTYDNESEFVQLSWNYMSDALRSNVFVRYTPEAIACACIYLSARILKIPLPNNPPWFVIFDTTEAQIVDICENILTLYDRPKVNYEQLEKKLEQLIKAYQDSKQKHRSGTSTSDKAALGTPTSASPLSRPASPQGSAPANASSTEASTVNNGKDKVIDDNKEKKKDKDDTSKAVGKRSAPSSPEPAKRSRRTPSPIVFDDSPKRHKRVDMLTQAQGRVLAHAPERGSLQRNDLVELEVEVDHIHRSVIIITNINHTVDRR
ncbi:Cyclin-L1 [Orchesella cincta]|uniref:Cyclin-L1 n=1 Tax=Orchesella cincta TaxID=48709 RepID=A0A1D2NJR0_ORCCI|nr:Cyclin-L1 [Orchesella cincta]